MRRYLSYFKMRFINGLQYRAAALGGIATQFVWGCMLILMYSAFLQTNAQSFPFDMSYLASYIWLQQALLALSAAWTFEGEILQSVSSGSVAYSLTRPVSIYGMWFSQAAAGRLSRAVLRCVPVIAFACFLPQPYSIVLPATFGLGAMFVLSLAIGLLVMVALNMLVYISTFYTISSQGTRLMFSAVGTFLSGSQIPLPFFPTVMQQVLMILPFASTVSTPFLIYVGYLSGSQAWLGLAVQAAWAILLIGVGVMLMNKALRRVVIQGG